MANEEHLAILEKGVEEWNRWRREKPDERPDLSGARLVGASLRRADLRDSNLRGADLGGADLSDANLSHADLSFADLNGADLMSSADLSRAILIESNLQGADLRGANLTGAYLYGADLSGGADLSCAVLIDANLSDANLSHANLSRANLGRTDLYGADLCDAYMTSEEASGEGMGSFLDLASCINLDQARFSEPEFLPKYLERAFRFAHRYDTRDAEKWPDFVAKMQEKINALRALYPDSEPPDSLVEAVQTITAELIQYLAMHPKAMYQIEPRQFEELIAEILASYGWEVKLTPVSKDGGFDIYAISPISGGETTSWIIECKKYWLDSHGKERKVGVDIARALYGVKYDLKVANAMLATTTHFTKGVHDFKASRYDLALRDYEGILEWLNEYRPNPNGRLYIKDNRLVVPGED